MEAATGTTVSAFDYDSFGNLEPTTAVGVTSPYTFSGRESDPESGLYYYRARYYDPFAGRFISEDPIGFTAKDLNLYRYVFNSPINALDPDGKQLVFAAAESRESVIQGAQVGGFVGSLINRIFTLVQLNLAFVETQLPGSDVQEFRFAITNKPPLERNFTKDIRENFEKHFAGQFVEFGELFPSLNVQIIVLSREAVIDLFNSRIRPGTGFDLLMEFLKEENPFKS